MSKYRHEYKYVCDLKKMTYIENLISNIMDLDSHARKNGSYTIRSLYFDDYNNQCYYDNLHGNEPREKFRIRIYDNDSSHINLELKKKERGKVHKASCKISREICEKIIGGEFLEMNAINSPVYRKFCVQYYSNYLRPRIIVEYDRIPYVYSDGNVRVTLDKNIRSSNQCLDFFEKDIFFRPIMEKDVHLLEVKFDEYVPDFIYQLIDNKKLQQSTFSKYFLCRKYSLGGDNNEF